MKLHTNTHVYRDQKTTNDDYWADDEGDKLQYHVEIKI